MSIYVSYTYLKFINLFDFVSKTVRTLITYLIPKIKQKLSTYDSATITDFI